MEKVKASEKGKLAVEAAKEPEKGAGSSFSKEQLLSSKRFQKDRDIVDALLLPDKMYTVESVKRMIETYRKGKVR